MHQPGHVLFHVDVMDAQHPGGAGFGGQFDAATPRQRLVGLRELVALGQVGIIVDLLVEGAEGLQLGIQRQTDQGGLFQCRLAQPGLRARQPQACRTGIEIGFVSRPVGAVAEQFRGAVEFHMDFQSDDRFEIHGYESPWKASSSSSPAASNRAS